MKIDSELVKDAGLRTFEYAAPLILVGTVVAVWSAYGWLVAALLIAGYMVAASLAWRAAWIAYRRRTEK